MKTNLMKEQAYLLSEYANKYNTVNYNNYIELYFNEYHTFNIDDIYILNEYFEDIEDYNSKIELFNEFEFNDLFCNIKPFELAKMFIFGSVNYNDDYFNFDGYGNIQTLSFKEIVEDYMKDNEFEEYYFTNFVLNKKISENEVYEVLEECNKLLVKEVY